MRALYILSIMICLPFTAAAEPPASIVRMTEAAQKFIASLDADQRALALKPFSDAEREENRGPERELRTLCLDQRGETLSAHVPCSPARFRPKTVASAWLPRG